jgi:hypothetical protein
MNHACFLLGLFKGRMYNMPQEAELLGEAIQDLLKRHEKDAKR